MKSSLVALLAALTFQPLVSLAAEPLQLTQYQLAKLLAVSTPAFERSEVCASSIGVVSCTVSKRITVKAVAVKLTAGEKTLSISARIPDVVRAESIQGLYAVELFDEAEPKIKMRIILRQDANRTVYLGLRIMNLETSESLANAFEASNLPLAHSH